MPVDVDVLAFEKKARQKGFKTLAGIDEAGRGPLAGPVVSAACILEEGLQIPGIDDSKKLTPKQREKLFSELIHHPGVIYAVGVVDSPIIDEINILQATIQSMMQAVDALDVCPDYLLVDGLKLPHPTIPSEKIIKGDSLSHSIGAASIIAKHTRDLIMEDYHQKWPEYGFNRHKGYGTKAHCEALHQWGPCAIHRKTFEPIKSLLS